MTYSISVQGHGDEPYEERKETEQALLAGVVDALRKHGGNVTTFSFSGNEVSADSWAAAEKTVDEETS